MTLIKLSEHERKSAIINLSNVFIEEYVPFAPNDYVKVYLTVLSYAATGKNATLEDVSTALFIGNSTVNEAINYWEEQGLLHVISYDGTQTLEILPVIPKERQIRKFSKEKYRNFNELLHALIPSRNILPSEYNEYYTVMETYNIEVEAMITIVGYCVKLKGEDVGYPYITTVARNLAKEGCITFDRVNERLNELNLYSSDIKAVLKALGSKKSADHEDKRLYDKWTKQFGFASEIVIFVAKRVKNGGITRLDALLTKYYELKLFSRDEIESYENNRDKLYKLAREINRIIGVYYEQLDHIIETYINKWLNMGFEDDALTTVADYCFKRNMRTLEGMNSTLEKLYKAGCVTVQSIFDFVSSAAKIDEEIKAVLMRAEVDRLVTARDRDYYHTWTTVWNLSSELINYAAELSRGKTNPIAYLNGILASYHANNVTTVDDAKKYSATAPIKQSENANVVTQNFSADELNAAFDKLYKELI